MPESLLSQISNLRKLFSEVTPTDSKVVSNYAWTIVKLLLQYTEEVDSVTARQLLAECLKLPIERPSQLYSALLSAAVKVANAYPEFRFASFLRLWGINNLRPEDNERQQASSPQSSSSLKKNFPSLVEKTTKALAHSLLLHPEDELTTELIPMLQTAGYQVRSSSLSSSSSLTYPLLVTRIKEVVSKEGRKLIFVTLTSPEGLEVECISSQLQPSPLHPLPEGKRHYVNIGQLYDCLLHTKQESSLSSSLSLKEAYLSQQKPTEVFPTEIGYIESIDQQHGHMHIYDAHSRHFVAPILRFSKEKVGDFIRFIPIIPAVSKFKTAIILATVPHPVGEPAESTSEVQTILREIRITHINKEKGYAAWELVDKTHPITELLSPLQLSQGETSPTFTTGYLNLTEELSSSLSLSSYKAFIYLRRGKDCQKRPTLPASSHNLLLTLPPYR